MTVVGWVFSSFGEAMAVCLLAAALIRVKPKPRPPQHRPDYAKIARLERELGIGQPPPEPPHGGPFLRKLPAASRPTEQPQFQPKMDSKWEVEPAPPGEIVGGMEWYMRQQGRPKR